MASKEDLAKFREFQEKDKESKVCKAFFGVSQDGTIADKYEPAFPGVKVACLIPERRNIHHFVFPTYKSMPTSCAF